MPKVAVFDGAKPILSGGNAAAKPPMAHLPQSVIQRQKSQGRMDSAPDHKQLAGGGGGILGRIRNGTQKYKSPQPNAPSIAQRSGASIMALNQPIQVVKYSEEPNNRDTHLLYKPDGDQDQDQNVKKMEYNDNDGHKITMNSNALALLSDNNE